MSKRGKTTLTNDQVRLMRIWCERDGMSWKAVAERASLEFQIHIDYDRARSLLSYEVRNAPAAWP